MILSDATLRKLLASRKLVVRPLKKNSIQCASIDCNLGNHFLVIDGTKVNRIDLDAPVRYRELKTDTITMPPHSFLLATTKEYIELPADISASVEGRSSIGRLGLFIQNAGWVDPGFKGTLTLELFNANSVPIVLKAGRRICQLVFYAMDRPVEHPYSGKYQGQRKTVGSKISHDDEVRRKQ